MRAIDNYTDKELNELALKGMTAPRTASELGTSDASQDELERWIATTLVNDEASTDKELIEHFQQGDEIPYEQAKFYVNQRNRALKHGLTFKLESYRPAPNKAQHSPLPWRLDFNKYDRQYRVYSVSAPVTNSMFHADNDADCKLIVASVNHAPGLAEALRFALSQIETLAHHAFSAEVPQWLARCDAMNCGKRALKAYDADQ